MNVDDLSLWRAFFGVAQTGGFSKASKVLNIPIPHVSKKVAKLEDQLGVRLFHRSTRVVRLTDEGAALLPKIANILDDLSEIQADLKGNGDFSGQVKVTCVPYVAHRLLLPAMKEFWERYPKIKVDLMLTKQLVNIVEQNFDMAIRIQTPPDSDLIYRKLAPNKLVFCASPQYLKNHKAPRNPNDLKDHDLLFLKAHEECQFEGDSLRLRKFAPQKKVECDSGIFLTEMALQGHGILVRANWDVEDHLKKGRLVQVLQKHPLETFGHIHCVIPSRRFLAPRVRAYFDFVVEKSARWRFPD